MKRIFSLTFVLALTLSLNGQWMNPNTQGVPAHNSAPPTKEQKAGQRPIVSQLSGPNFTHPAQVESYKAAARNADVLHQLPCYCYCDRGHGHNSLRTCFEDDHGARCGVCMQESIYADRMVKAGKTVKQIRDGINRGEHQQIDLQKVTLSKETATRPAARTTKKK